MTFEEVVLRLERRAPGRWELYRKTSLSRERDSAGPLSRVAHRREEGWAARWWCGDPLAMRFAASSSAEGLAAAVQDASLLPAGPDVPPDWPKPRAAKESDPGDEPPLEDPPDHVAALSAAIAAASSQKASLSSLALRAGEIRERIANASGLDLAHALRVFDGVACASARGASYAHAARAAFRWDPAAPGDVLAQPLAARLADAAALPLSGRGAPFRAGQWLLEPPVAAAIVAAVSGAFCGPRGPGWIAREGAIAPAVRLVDDASRESPWDGEGVASRRMTLFESGEPVARLFDLRSATAAGRTSTGHGVRPSFREPPRCGPRRIFFESSAAGAPSPESLASSVRRGLVARALTAPVRADLAGDRYEVEFTGVSLAGGRETGPVAGARASGRISELLRRIEAASSGVEFFPIPFLAGSPTLLVERASFD